MRSTDWQKQWVLDMKDLPQSLINEVQKHTNAPWWNGEAYASFNGYPQRIIELETGAGRAIDDLAAVIEWLREDKQFDKADRLRTIAGCLARDLNHIGDPDLTRVIAKGWK